MSTRAQRLLLAILAGLLVAGCGNTPETRHNPSPQTIGGHVCTPADEALQCVLPPVPSRLNLAPAPFVHGVDFAWGAPTVAQMHAYGARFGASYFSYDQSKGWARRPGLVASYHAAGIATVGVWETSAGRAGQGCGAGAADAREAARQARAVGNTSRPIDFAIDFDAEGRQVDSYFRCIHQILGARTSAYGGYYPLKYLCAHGLVGRTNWQTYAWSAGQWLPASCAPLEQYLNGSSVDYDRAIAADYGQWPGPVKPKPKPPVHSRKRETEHLHSVQHRINRTRVHLRNLGCRVKHPDHRRCDQLFAYGNALHAEARYLVRTYHVH